MDHLFHSPLRYPIHSPLDVYTRWNPLDPVLPLWKPKGISTHAFTQHYAEFLQEKCAHTGVLDPLAEGVILLLPGSHRFLKDQYTQGLKTYQVYFILGITTDSLDLLGQIQQEHPFYASPKEIYTRFHHTKPKNRQWINQKPPLMSNIKVEGKRLQYWTRRGRIIPDHQIPSRRVWLESSQLNSIHTLTSKEWLDPFLTDLTDLPGVFRQSLLLKQWQTYQRKDSPQNQSLILKCTLTVGRGFYVRSFVRDWCKDALEGFDTQSGCVIDLVRTYNGDFGYPSCLNRASFDE